MAKLDNVTKAKIDFNNEIIKTIENGERLTINHLFHFTAKFIDKYDLSENKNYYLFIEYVLSKFNLVTIDDNFFIFTRLISYLAITHDDKAMTVVINHFFDSKLTVTNLFDYADDLREFYHNDIGFLKTMSYIITKNFNN